MKRHKHTYTVEKEGNTTTRTSDISECPVDEKTKCIDYEIKKRKRFD